MTESTTTLKLFTDGNFTIVIIETKEKEWEIYMKYKDYSDFKFVTGLCETTYEEVYEIISKTLDYHEKWYLIELLEEEEC